VLSADPVAGGSALLFWSKVAGNAGFFTAVLILARALGPTGRGTIAFITVTALVVARIAGLGVAEATAVFAARHPDRRPALLSNLVVFMLGSAAVAGLIACVALIAAQGERPAGVGTPELGILAVATIASALSEGAAGFLLGCSRLRSLALITATVSWIYPALLAMIALVGELTVKRAALAWLAGESWRAYLLVRRSSLGVAPSRPDLALLRSAVSFGLRAWVGTLSRFLNFRVDQILMGFLASEAALGIYAVAVNASEALLYLPAATAAALVPVVAGGDAGRRAVDQTVRAFRSAALVTAAAIVVAAILGPMLLPLLFGNAFRPSVGPFLWLLPGAIGFAATAVFSSGLMASSAPGRSSLGPLASLAVGVALDLVLIPRYGASGAAAAASAAFLAGGATALIAYSRRSVFPWRDLVVPRRGDLDILRALARPLRASYIRP
jgi:O-antigen/teichoic acid export membrane protein